MTEPVWLRVVNEELRLDSKSWCARLGLELQETPAPNASSFIVPRKVGRDRELWIESTWADVILDLADRETASIAGPAAIRAVAFALLQVVERRHGRGAVSDTSSLVPVWSVARLGLVHIVKDDGRMLMHDDYLDLHSVRVRLLCYHYAHGRDLPKEST